MVTLLFGILGLIVGSFLNVLILRWGKQPLTGRSACPACGTTLRSHDLIPLLSWLILRGRCRYCRAPISIQYPLVELGTGVLFALIGAAPLSLSLQLLALPIAALLLAIAVYDLRTTFIPDAWVWTFNALALLSALAFSCQPPTANCQLSILAGPLVASPLFALWFFSRGRWMGFGDVKFALGMGWLLGAASGFFALFLAFIIGACVGVFLLFASSEYWKNIQARITPIAASQKFAVAYTMKSEVPFGPFLVLASLIVWFTDMYGIPITSPWHEVLPLLSFWW